MDRMTGRCANGTSYAKPTEVDNYEKGVLVLYGHSEYDYSHIISRLAEYEDTGLTPNEIMEMEAEWCALKQKQAELSLESIGIYDEEEIIEDCTIQIWRNSATGEESIGWWHGAKEDMPGYEKM